MCAFPLRKSGLHVPIFHPPHNTHVPQAKVTVLRVSASEEDEPRACYTEWSTSGREEQSLCIDAYMWNLEKWYWGTNLQGTNRGIKTEDRLVHTAREGETGRNWESSTETYTLLYGKQIARERLLYDTGNPTQCPVTTHRGGREVQKYTYRGCTYTSGWFMLLYGMTQHTIVEHLSVQSLSHVRIFVTRTAHQASVSLTNSRSFLRLMCIRSVMPSNHLILSRPRLLPPSIFPSIRVFSNESAVHMRWPKYWSFSFSISPSNEHPGLVSFRMDWLDLLAVQGTSRVFSNTTVQKHQFFGPQFSL